MWVMEQLVTHSPPLAVVSPIGKVDCKAEHGKVVHQGDGLHSDQAHESSMASIDQNVPPNVSWRPKCFVFGTPVLTVSSGL